MADVILFFPKAKAKKEEEIMILPAGLLMVAAPLLEKGYEVKIIDQRIDCDWKKTLLTELEKRPIVVGFTALTCRQILYALEAAKMVKERSSALTVWGGIHTSLLPQQTLSDPNIDFVIIGEGEKAFPELVESLAKKRSYENISGLGYKKDGQARCNPQSDFLNMDELLPIPYHLVDVENYITDRRINFYTSRGCPHRCAFCYNQEFNKRRWRGKSAERVVEEIEKLVRDYGITFFDIEDDEFFVDLSRAREIAELILKKNLKINISTSCRVNYIANSIDDQFLELLSSAGFKKLQFGVETGSERIQKLISKDIENWQVMETIRKLSKAKIVGKFVFMAGFPTETISNLYATCDLILEMRQLNRGMLIPPWRIFTPYPGSYLYELCVKEGFKPPQRLEDWATYDYETVNIPWVSSSRERIIKNVAFMIDFLELPKAEGLSPYQKLGRLYAKTVDFRWAHHWFLAPEKCLVEVVRRLHKAIKKR